MMAENRATRPMQMSLRLPTEVPLELSPEARSELVLALAALLRAAAAEDPTSAESRQSGGDVE